VLQEFYVTITRKITTSIENQIASQIVADLAHWRIHSPEPNDLIQAIDLQRVFQVSFWDAMVLQSASQIGCRQLFSEDLGHYQFYNSVQVINPFTGKNEWTFSPMPSMTA
jgi:predicted nucleic acid-binding protein